MTHNDLPTDRTLDLLADRATGSLDPAARAELDALLTQHHDLDDDSMDLAAAAAALALMGDLDPMPAGLRGRVLDAMEAPPPPISIASAPGAPRRRDSLLAWSGWLAAAACLTFALVVASRLAGPTTSPTDALQSFVQHTPDVKKAAWSDWDNPERPGVKGEVVWSETEQKGYMTFAGLTPNDAAKEQYQLWIIDERGMQQRISGAIFNCDDPQRTVVEIDPAIEVHGAAAFAVTIEPPGGVWVSDMTRRVVIASLQG